MCGISCPRQSPCIPVLRVAVLCVLVLRPDRARRCPEAPAAPGEAVSAALQEADLDSFRVARIAQGVPVNLRPETTALVPPLAKPQTLSGFPSSLPVPHSVRNPSQGHMTFCCLLCPLWSGAVSQTRLTSHDLDRFEQFWLWIWQSVSPIDFVWCFLMMRCYSSWRLNVLGSS